MSKKRILITGNGSYVGANLIEWLSQWPDQYEIKEISVRGEEWKSKDFSKFDSVLHVAGIAHVSTDPKMEEQYYKVNRDLTIEVAKYAKSNGVKQFIFMSSIIVYGDSSSEKRVIDRSTMPKPSNFYGNSKLQAEEGIKLLESEAFKVVVIRPPMIYGKNSKGNYPKLAKAAKVLPIFPDFDNERSMLHIDNLSEFLRLMVENEERGLFFPQNKEYVKTSEMVKNIAQVHGKDIKLVKIFNFVIKPLVRKVNILNKVFGNLVYDMSISGYKEEYQIKNLRDSIINTERNKNNQKVKICVVHTISKTLDWFVVDSMRYLNDNGYEVYLVGNMEKEFVEKNKDFAHCLHIPMGRGINLYNAFRATYKIYRLFKKENFDIIQYSTPNASLYASLAGKLAKVPVRLYCQWGLRYVSMTGIKRIIFKAIEKQICKYSTWIEPDSFGNLKYVRDEGLYNEQKSSVVWNGSANGVNLQRFDISKKEVWRLEMRNILGINQDEFVFGFVGRVDPDKGFNELIESFKYFEGTRAKLLIVGMEDKIESVNAKLYSYSKLSNQILYTGVVSDVEKYMSMMDCLVLPSYREGFGSVIIEAEAMGIPVIVTDIPGPTEAMIKDVTGLLVKKADVETLKYAMNIMYSDSEKRKRMGEAAYEYASKNFEQKKLFASILEDRNRLLKI